MRLGKAARPAPLLGSCRVARLPVCLGQRLPAALAGVTEYEPAAQVYTEGILSTPVLGSGLALRRARHWDLFTMTSASHRAKSRTGRHKAVNSVHDMPFGRQRKPARIGA